MTESRTAVGSVDDFAEGSITQVTVGDRDLVLIREGGEFYAMPDRCTHAKYPLHDGELDDGKIRCAHHGATFDLETGKPSMPAYKKIQLFDVQVDDATVYVRLREN